MSSGGGKINLCPYAFNLIAFNHSIWCKWPEIISKADAKMNLLSQCTDTGLLPAWHRDVDLSGMDALLAGRPVTSMPTAPSCQLLMSYIFWSFLTPISQTWVAGHSSGLNEHSGRNKQDSFPHGIHSPPPSFLGQKQKYHRGVLFPACHSWGKREEISSESPLGCRNSPTHKFSSPSAKLVTGTARWAMKLIYHIKS